MVCMCIKPTHTLVFEDLIPVRVGVGAVESHKRRLFVCLLMSFYHDFPTQIWSFHLVYTYNWSLFLNPILQRWLLFLRGVVDSDDLPLNVGREILQQSRYG
jgi:hypothetical protein